MSPVDDLLRKQNGVISRSQAIKAGLKAHDIRRLIRNRHWALVHPGVYVNHTGAPTWQQRAWAAVLHYAPAALAAESAMRAAEGPGRKQERSSLMHVAVSLDRHLVPLPGVRLVRMPRLDTRAQWNTSPPRVRYEEAALDVALAAATPMAAIATIADAVQSRCTTALRMADSLASRPRVHARAWVAGVLADVATGTCSVLEHGYLDRVERPHGLPAAERQSAATASVGLVYRDAEYAVGLIVELDGRLFHDTATARDEDFERDLDAATDGRETIRLSWGQVFDRGCSTAGKLGVLLQRRGWTGTAQPCGPGCALASALTG